MATLDDGRSGLTRATEWVGSGRDRRTVSVLFGAAVAASGLLLLVLGSKLTFLLDDWSFLLYRPGLNADSVLTPHGEHIVAGPVLLYKLLQSTFGMESALPFRVFSVGAFLTSAVLLFVYLRRRIDPWLALAAAVIVLFLGPAWEDLLWSFQIGFFTAMSAGLGMLLCLERQDRAGDVGACALLTVAVVFSSLGLPFAVAAAVVVLRGSDRWRRLYVVVLPLLVYGLWYLGWGREAESAVSLENLATTPLFVLDSVAAAAASILGLATPHAGTEAAGGLEWGRPIVVGLVVLVAWRLHSLGRIPTWLWTVVALGASFWIFAGLNEKEGRSPTVSRYQYVGAIFLILILAELLRGVKLGFKGVAVLAVVLAAALVSNGYYLGKAYDSYHQTSQLERGGLGAVEIAADTVEPGFVLTEELADTGYVHVDAGTFLATADEYGSPAYSPAELAEAPENVRYAADKVLSAALRISYEPLPDGTDLPAPKAAPASGGELPVAAGRCLKVTDSAPGAVISLPPEGAVVAAGGAAVESLSLRRYSTGTTFPVKLEGAPAAGEAAAIRIPPDRSSEPWQLLVEGAGTATVCGLPQGGA